MKRTVFFSLALMLLPDAPVSAQDKAVDASIARIVAEASRRSTNGYNQEFIDFVATQRRRAHVMVADARTSLDPRVKDFFDAMERLDFASAEQIFHQGRNVLKPVGIASAMHECIGLYPLYGEIPPQRLKALAVELGDSIPTGAILFGGTDIGRFLPTWYEATLNPEAGFFPVTQNAFADFSYLEYLRAWHGDSIRIPSAEDSQEAFQTYVEDAQARLQHDLENPDQPKKIKKGEKVKVDPLTRRVSVSGQVAVMAINALLAKKLFDLNPQREFYVEESFPLDWMYPHLRPHGLMMKLERKPIEKLSLQQLAQDRSFWKRQSDRLVGDWLDADTPFAEVASFVRRVHHHRQFAGFNGDREFIETDFLKKVYAKFRVAIAGVYHWRMKQAAARGDIADQRRMTQAADFAFRQAWALHPTSPEIVFRYNSLLVQHQRFGDAKQLCLTFLQIEPENEAVRNLYNQIKSDSSPSSRLNKLRQQYANDPRNVELGCRLGAALSEQGQKQEALAIVEQLAGHESLQLRELLHLIQLARSNDGLSLITNSLAPRLLKQANRAATAPDSSEEVLNWCAQAFNTLGQLEPLEKVMTRLTELRPDSPETWYDLAGVRAVLKLEDQAIEAATAAVLLNAERLKTNASARDIRPLLRTDMRFDSVRRNPAFPRLQ